MPLFLLYPPNPLLSPFLSANPLPMPATRTHSRTAARIVCPPASPARPPLADVVQKCVRAASVACRYVTARACCSLPYQSTQTTLTSRKL
jgi:hypothetical protein